jgi:hypothetical protein
VRRFELARRALRDLQEVWEFVSKTNFTAADGLLEEFYQIIEIQLLCELRALSTPSAM